MKEESILQAILKMYTFIDSGYSLEVAKKNVNCSNTSSDRYKSITRHPEYLNLLNYYCAKKKMRIRYTMIDGKFKSTKYVPEIKTN